MDRRRNEIMAVLAKWENDDAVAALRAIRAAALIRSKHVTQLSGVLLTNGVAVASDGYCLITVPLVDYHGGPDVMIPDGIITQLEKIKLTKKTRPGSFSILDDDQAIIVGWWAVGSTPNVITAPKTTIDQFPSWQRLVPPPEDWKITSTAPALLSAELLSRVGKVAAELDDPEALVQLRHMPSPEQGTLWSLHTRLGEVMWVQMPVVKQAK
jgi:hypothetical protein